MHHPIASRRASLLLAGVALGTLALAIWLGALASPAFAGAQRATGVITSCSCDWAASDGRRATFICRFNLLSGDGHELPPPVSKASIAAARQNAEPVYRRNGPVIDLIGWNRIDNWRSCVTSPQ